MVEILIVAHTPLANALLEFVGHTYGDIPKGIHAINVPPHEDIKVTQQKLQEIIEQIGSDHEVLILTDIIGATPNNVAMRLTTHNKMNLPIQIITGVNLPMLLRAVSHRHEPIEEVAKKALLGGKNGVLKIREINKVSS
jgi:mannose PTS system EIIA component